VYNRLLAGSQILREFLRESFASNAGSIGSRHTFTSAGVDIMLLDSRSGFPVVADRPTSSPILRFNAAVLKKDLAKARDNLSAVVLRDNHLWLGGDEGTSIDRMTRDASGNFGDHSRFELKDLLKLPASAKEEIDIEGLDVDGGYLWAIGSHSAKRKKAESDKSPAEPFRATGCSSACADRCFAVGRW
jgi:hypothetical protein